MTSWMNNLRAFGRGSNPTRSNQPQAPNRSNTSSPTTYSPSSLIPPPLPNGPASPSLTATMQHNDSAHQTNQVPTHKIPLFFREEHSGFIARGNFMTLAMKPQLVEQGEWLAHQMSEQYRLLGGMLKIVQEVDPTRGKSICSDQSCPTMSAGSASYTWIDQNRNPMPLPAPTYTKHIQIWVGGKVLDTTLFPVDPFTTAPSIPSPSQQSSDPSYWLGKPSGFPQRYEAELKNMYKQMFRCYAHLYWSHWLAFWDLGAYRELNTCFVHFVNVGRLYGLLAERDVEPMQPLVELWVKQGVLPKVGKEEASAPGSAGGMGQGGSQAISAAA
nr:hypothetical protein B0A51_01145 [Rachicladosporium sp. CCFEE 5018]